ncbi:MAG: hypothetical protein IKS01_05075 [Paludibacteraceae bacterium]|nr:hypothetical protein [Paludibacteraceae bacterium]
MKHTFTLIFCLISLCVMGTTNYTAKEQKDIARHLLVAQKLSMKHQYLEALDSATVSLSMYEDAYSLRDFVRKNWNKAMTEVQNRIDTLQDETSIPQTEERIWVYQRLVSINDNLSTVSLPLTGRNGSWVWQPDMEYWAGHLDHEERLLQHLLDEQKRQEELEQKRMEELRKVEELHKQRRSE